MYDHFTPPQAPLVLVKATKAYRLWHQQLQHTSRVDRYTTGARIDDIFIGLLEYLYQASFAHDKFEKLSLVLIAIGKCDLLKFFLRLAWEQKIIQTKCYADTLILLEEVGRMLGGWRRQIAEKTSPKK